MYRRILENCPSGNLPGYGPALLIKRPVRTRMQGVVGAGGTNPRLPDYVSHVILLRKFLIVLVSGNRFRKILGKLFTISSNFIRRRTKW